MHLFPIRTAGTCSERLSIPGMAGTGNLRLSRGSLIHPHTPCPTSDVLSSAFGSFCPDLSISFYSAALFSFFLSFSLFALLFFARESVLLIAQYESRSHTFGGLDAEERLCEHAETAGQLCLYWSWPDGELLIAIAHCT
jgi:hypothetical protein